MGDLVRAMGACTTSNFAAQYHLPGLFAPTASFPLLKTAEAVAAARKDLHCVVGNVLSADVFYDDVSPVEDWRKMGVLAVEMEANALYCNAARAGKQALAMFTVSDELLTGASASATERQTAFTAMMEVALDTAAAL